MIILRLKDNNEASIKSKVRKRRRNSEKLFDYSRSGIVINNKPHFIISVDRKTLDDIDFLNMLRKYKGDILTSEELEAEPCLNELLFDLKPFKKRALFESFINTVGSGAFSSSKLLIYDFDLYLKDEIEKLFPFFKAIAIITASPQNFSDWCDKCFYEYGVRPIIKGKDDVIREHYDVILNFENLENNTLVVNACGKEKIIYPDYKFLEVPDELKILRSFNLSNTMICAAFKNNNFRSL